MNTLRKQTPGGPSIIVFNCNCCQYSRLAEFDEVLVCGPRWQAPDIQVGLTQLLCSSLAAVVGAWAGRSHGMRGWSIGLLGTNEKREEKLKIKTQQVTSISELQSSPVDGHKNAPGFMMRVFFFHRSTVQRKTRSLLAIIDNIITIHTVQSNFTARQFTPEQDILI